MSLAESKHKVQAYQSFSLPLVMNATWTFNSFFTNALNANTIQIGTSSSDRIGSKIFVKSIEYRFIVKPTGGGGMDTSGGNTCRFIVFHDRQTNGALISPLTVFRADNVNTMRNQDQLKRAFVKRDMLMTMISTSSTTVGPTYPIVGKLAVNKTFTYISNTDSIASLLTDNYGFGFIADAGLCCEIYGEYIVHFTDV